MDNLDRGYLVTIEGIDGCGKTTFLEKLAPLLKSRFHTVITKEPGDSTLGKHLRKVLQEQIDPLTPIAEYLLFAADRAQHMHEVIAPALAQKKLVVSDRLADSSVVYQGFARGLDIQLINEINQWALKHRTPDLTFFIDIDPTIALQRIAHRNEELTAFERGHKEFMNKVRIGYHTWFTKKQHIITLDGAKKVEFLAQEALDHIIKKVHHA